jgi:hypothetical protein
MKNLLLASALAGALLVAGTAVPASAATAAPADVDVPTTLAAIQAAGARATAARISAIDRTIPTLTRNECISDASRGQVLGSLESASDGMTTLRDEIAAATTVEEAATDYRAVFEEWRVYAVVIPQAHYVAAAECLEGTSIPTLLDVQAGLEAALAAVPDRVTPEIEASMAELDAQLATAQSEIAGVSAATLAVTVDDYNADPAVLSDLRLSISSASSAVRLARIAAGDVVEALR